MQKYANRKSNIPSYESTMIGKTEQLPEHWTTATAINTLHKKGDRNYPDT